MRGVMISRALTSFKLQESLNRVFFEVFQVAFAGGWTRR